jgi:hypothetical protein
VIIVALAALAAVVVVVVVRKRKVSKPISIVLINCDSNRNTMFCGGFHCLLVTEKCVGHCSS